MTEQDIVIKKGYDVTYPPLNKKRASAGDAKTIDTAMSSAVKMASNPKDLVIQHLDLRFTNRNAPLVKEMLKKVEEQFSVETKIAESHLGNLVVKMDGAQTNIDKAKFILRESLSKQKTRTFELSPKCFNLFAKENYHVRLCKNRYLCVRMADPTRTVTLDGGAASVDSACKEIDEFISWNENSVTMSIEIPVLFHSFIRGHNDVKINNIIEKAGHYVKVGFIPEGIGIIVLVGNKMIVEATKDLIQKQYESLSRELVLKHIDASEVQFQELRSLLNEFSEEKLGISFIIHSFDKSKYMIDILGESQVVNLFIEKANSIKLSLTPSKLNTPYWVCKFFTTSQDAINNIKTSYPKAKIMVHPHQESIEVVCEREYADEIFRKLTKCIEDITLNKIYEYLMIPEEFGKFFLGRDKKLIESVQLSTKTLIFIENKVEGLTISNFRIDAGNILCTIVGQPDCVLKAKSQIQDHIQKIKQYKIKRLVVPDRLCRFIIGANGRKLNDIIQRYGPNCLVSFGKPPFDADQCTINGPEEQLKTLEDAINNLVIKFGNLHYLEQVEIPERFVQFIQSDKLDYLTKIKNSCNLVEINLIANKKDNTIVEALSFVGQKQNVKKAIQQINLKIREINETTSQSILVPESLNEVLDVFGCSVFDTICSDIGSGLKVSFSNKGEKYVLTLFGQSKLIKTVVYLIKQFFSGSHNEYYYEIMKTSEAYVNNLNVNGGIPVIKIVRSHTIRVIFPISGKSAQDAILLLGKKNDVLSVKDAIKEEIKVMENTVERIIQLKSKHKNDFLKRRNGLQSVVEKISHDNRVKISFESIQSNNEYLKVSIRGCKSNVEIACQKIQECATTFENKITQTVESKESDLHFAYLNDNYFTKYVMDMHDVIMIVPKESYERIINHNVDNTRMCIITIVGMPENVKNACNLIKSWKVVEKTISFSARLQKSVLAYDTNFYNELTTNYFSDIIYGYLKPNPQDTITIRCFEGDMDRAYDFVMRHCSNFYEHCINIPNKHFVKIIGKDGSNIRRFDAENNVKVSLSKFDDTVMIKGPKDNCLVAADKLQKMVYKWDHSVSKTLEFNSRAKVAFIGEDKSELNKLRKDCNVEIKLRKMADDLPPSHTRTRTLEVFGLPEDVDECIKLIKQRLETILEDMDDEYCYRRPSDFTYNVDLSKISTYQYIKKPKQKNNIKKGLANLNINGKQSEQKKSDGTQNGIPYNIQEAKSSKISDNSHVNNVPTTEIELDPDPSIGQDMTNSSNK